MMPARHRKAGSHLRARCGIAEQASVAQSTGARQRIHRVSNISRSGRSVPDLAEVRATASGKASRTRPGHCKPAAPVVAAAKMRVAEAMMSAAAEMPAAAAMTSAMTTMATAVTAAMAATFTDGGARQHCHQDHDGNSDCPVGHGSLLRPLMIRHKKDADRQQKFHRRSRRGQAFDGFCAPP
jgi:hypothetical protein